MARSERTETKSSGAPSPRRPSYRWPVALVILGIAAIGLGAYVFRETRSLPGDLLDKSRSVAGELRSVAEGFRTGTITVRFVSYATEMTGSNYLQFATLEEVEIFERTDRATVMWGRLALPDVVVRAEAPVEYTYYLDLEEDWRFELENRRVRVEAPRIRYNTPAIDVSRIRYEIKNESVLRNEALALRNLAQGLTRLSKTRAEENVELVRELGRKKTAEFIRTWLLAHYEDADQFRVDVVFADELAPEPPERPGETALSPKATP